MRTLLTLEKRPTSVVRLAKLAMGAVFGGVVVVGFIAPLVVQWQYTSVATGDRVQSTSLYDGFSGEVSGIEDGVVTVTTPNGETRRFPVAQVREL